MWKYKGWLSFCPIHTDCMSDVEMKVRARHPSLIPLLWLALQSQQLRIYVCSFVFPAWRPSFKVKITGEL